MKIVYILPYDWGGMPHYTAEIANAVAENADVIIIGSKEVPSEYFSDKVKIIRLFEAMPFSMNHLENILSLRCISAMFSFNRIKLIKEINPDLIHLTTPLLPPLAFFLFFQGIDKKIPIIYTKHGLHSNSGLVKKIFEEYILNFFERLISFKKIIVHTEFDRSELITTYNINNEDIFVIPHGIYSFFRQFESSIPEEKNTILFFGNIREYKGLDVLLSAIPIIENQKIMIKTIIAGEGDIAQYQDLIKNCNGANFEIFNHYIPDDQVSVLFQRSSLVVLPYTKMSGMSGILNIAYAFGKPVVVSDVGGLEEIIENNKTGILVPPKDPVQLANAIIRLLSDSELRYSMERSVKKKSKELSWDSVATKTINVYIQSLKRKNN